ncbi:hypothetical protein QFC19_000708 [Naganishia cerealis]|uniref:Uncharacterized protein n=1 Tax=Naganishia cerealis TaxID=610337 RepID=A0ACC2WMB0_9TREE|nr:hypothetical protein QFC19_000708 [Naganishia cerealis]
MRIGAGTGYASPSASGNLNVNPLDANTITGRISPSLSHPQPYGSRPGSPMNIRAFDALNAAVAAVDAAAAQEASLPSPGASTGGGGTSMARRTWNMQPNNNLGTLTSLSRTSSRGMDSPVSAERSGMLEDEDDSDEAVAAAAAAHHLASGARHLTGTSVLSSSRDGSPIGSLEYFDRRMGGGSVISGTRVTSGRGGSKLRDMDIDSALGGVEAAVKLEPGSSSYPEDMQDSQQRGEDVHGNAADEMAMDDVENSRPESLTPAATADYPALPSSSRTEDDGDTPTGEDYADTERVPRIAFQEVQ